MYDLERLPWIDWVDMHEHLDDFESPYFDWDNNRMFDVPARRLIDQIADDPRFFHSFVGAEIVKELAPNKGEDEQQRLFQAAWAVFVRTVLPDLAARASQLVDRALADPAFEALPVWSGEPSGDRYNSSDAYTDPDPRVLELFKGQLESPEVQEEALAGAENEARIIVGELPRRTRDLLVLSSRNAYRESLLAPWIERLNPRRRGWIAYYGQRIVRQDDEESVLDRYCAAAKILHGQKWSKKSIANALGVTVGRIDRLLERSGGQDITETDPLCDLVPDLRGRGEDWRNVAPIHADEESSFRRLSVAEKVALADESADPLLLERLAKEGSHQVSKTLINRYCQRGDVDEHVLRTILSAYPSPWMRPEMIEANRLRRLSIDLALELASDDPRVLLDCDEETIRAAESLECDKFKVALAFRQSDIAEIEGILAAGRVSKSFRELVTLLIDRPLTEEMLGSSRLLTALEHAAEQTDDFHLATELRLISYESASRLAQYLEQAKDSGTAAVSPKAIVEVALGPYHESGEGPRAGVKAGARAVWEATDLTPEHCIARAAVAKLGAEVVSLETAGNIFVVTADAIRSFRKSDVTEYTYVSMYLPSAFKGDLGGMTVTMPSTLPTLGYHREMRKHPRDAVEHEVEAIVWPIPFQPAIYSLEPVDSIGAIGALIAVSGGKVAIVKGP